MRFYELITDFGNISDGGPMKHHVVTKDRVPLDRIVEFWIDYDVRITGLKYQEWNVEELRKLPPAYIEKGKKLEGGRDSYNRERYVYDLGDITEQELAVLEKFEFPIKNMTDRY